MRNTRANARAGGVYIDETAPMDAANVPLPTTPLPERNPLAEVSVNSSEPRPEYAPVGDEDPDQTMKKGKGKTKKAKGARKAAKDNKIRLAARQNSDAVSQEPEVLEDGISVVSSAASEEAAEELRREHTGEIFQVPMHDERPMSPPSPAVRATRLQLAKTREHQVDDRAPVDAKVDNVNCIHEHQPAEPQLKSDDPAPEKDSQSKIHNLDEPKKETAKSGYKMPMELTIRRDSRGALIIAQQVPGPDITGTVHGSALLEQSDAHASEQVSSARKSTNARVEDSIEAMDALEEEIEKVQKDLSPIAVAIMPETIRKAQTTPTRKAKSSTSPSPVGQHDKDRASIASMRTSGPQKLASTTKFSSPPKPAEGAQQKTKTTVARTASQRTRNATRPAADRERKPVEIPCSKPRPMHLSFPTPPPPPKSTKPPTTSTFALPGAAVAAKLKAAREERLKRAEEEAQKKPEPKARPVRKSVAPVVKLTTTSIARQSMMHAIPEAKDNGQKNATPVKSMKRTSTVPAAKDGTRMSTVASRRSPTTVQKSSVITEENPDGNKGNQAAPSAGSKRQPLSSSSTANTSKLRVSPSASVKSSTLKPRISSLTSNASGISSASRTSQTSHTSAVPSQSFGASSACPINKADMTAQRTKGKEVFNRDKVEKEEMERKRREKEEAAKRARAEAAERGRVASRAWAEKRGTKKPGVVAAAAGLGKVHEGGGMKVEQVEQKA